MKRVRVLVRPHPYDVFIGRGALDAARLRRHFKSESRGIVVSSREVMRRHGETLEATLVAAGFKTSQVVMLRDGESAKVVREWERTVRAMARAQLDRSSFVIAFGGGSVGDAAGFAAATYMRGVRMVQIPTTLLSMVDSSVGGKTGINLAEGKNLVGAFHQPGLVLADLRFLETLPERERQSGVYEILKCGILRSSRLFRLLERTSGLRRASEHQVESAITGAVRVKARIVERDERESGERVLLNFGHTLGHALEAATSYRGFTHGEAVGYGMDFAVDLGEELNITSASAAARIRAAIEEIGPRTPLRRSMVPAARRAVHRDKKRDGAKLKEVLVKAPENPVIHTIPAASFARLAGAWIEAKTRLIGTPPRPLRPPD